MKLKFYTLKSLGIFFFQVKNRRGMKIVNLMVKFAVQNFKVATKFKRVSVIIIIIIIINVS